jgi:hypothetical protein
VPEHLADITRQNIETLAALNSEGRDTLGALGKG